MWFSVKLPKDLGTKKLTWTIVANGFTNAITLHTQADYIVEPHRGRRQQEHAAEAEIRSERSHRHRGADRDRGEADGDRRSAAAVDGVGDG